VHHNQHAPPVGLALRQLPQRVPIAGFVSRRHAYDLVGSGWRQ